MRGVVKTGLALFGLVLFSGWCVAKAVDLVAGIDTDGNGVRDDVDKYVASLPDTKAQQQALLQMSMSLQKEMTMSLKDKEALKTAHDAWGSALSCIYYSYHNHKISEKKIEEIEDLTINTSERAGARKRFIDAINNYLVDANPEETGCLYTEK